MPEVAIEVVAGAEAQAVSDARAALATLWTKTSDFACGRIAKIELGERILPEEEGGAAFPLAAVTLDADRVSARNGAMQIQVLFWGDPAPGAQLFTSSTPPAVLGDDVCLFSAIVDGQLWLTIHGYRRLRAGRFDLGPIRVDPVALRAAERANEVAPDNRSTLRVHP